MPCKLYPVHNYVTPVNGSDSVALISVLRRLQYIRDVEKNDIITGTPSGMPSIYPVHNDVIRTPVNVIDIVATASFYIDFVMTQLQRDHDVLEFFRYNS